jgi:multicomponent Na+:H+ antiporter subunit G
LKELMVTVLLLSGVFLMLTASIGVARLPDLFCRGHALAKAMTLGVTLMLLGLWLHLGAEEAGLKVFLAIFFQIVTIPVAGHLIGLIGYRKNVPRWKQRPMYDHRNSNRAK